MTGAPFMVPILSKRRQAPLKCAKTLFTVSSGMFRIFASVNAAMAFEALCLPGSAMSGLREAALGDASV